MPGVRRPPRRPRQGAGDRPVQLGPERHPAALHGQLCPPGGHDGRRDLQQVHRDQLVQHGAGHVDTHPRRGQPLHLRRRGPDPADPQPAPERLAHATDAHHPGVPVEARRRRWQVGPVQRQVHERLVDHQVGADRVRGGHQPFPQLGRHQVPGRVLEVGNQVTDAGSNLPQRTQQQVRVPAVGVGGQAVRGDPGPPGGQGREGVRVARRLDQDPAARRERQPQHQVQGVLRAVGDHDLVRRGGQPPFGVPLGDRLPQLDDPDRVVPGAIEVAGQILGRRPGRRQQLGRGGQRRHTEVEHVPVVQWDPQSVRRDPVRPRQHRPASGTPPAGQVSAVAQFAVRGRDGGTADPQRLGQVPFGGQAHAEGEPTVGEQAAYRTGQRGIVGAAPPTGQGVPLPEQPGQLDPTHLTHHGHSPEIGSIAPPIGT